MNLELRPLSVGELFDRAFTLYRRNLWLFVGITAIPAVFALVMTIGIQSMQRVMATGLQASVADSAAAGDVAMTILWMAAGVLIFAVVYWVVYMIALGATTYAVSELYVNRSTTIRQSYARMRGRIGALIVLMLLVGIRVALVWIVGTVALVLGSVLAGFIHPLVSGVLMVFGLIGLFLAAGFMMLRYGMSVPALVVEGLPPGNSIRRSIELTRGRLFRVFLLVLCAMMVTYAAMLIFQGPFAIGAVFAGPDSATAFWLNIAGAVSGTVGTTFTTPFMIIGLALLYYDARIREEGFDLELTLQALDARAGMAGV